MTDLPVVYFVWAKSMQGPVPMKVCGNADDGPRLAADIKKHVYVAHPLPKHEELLTLTQLEQKYPKPKGVLQ